MFSIWSESVLTEDGDVAGDFNHCDFRKILLDNEGHIFQQLKLLKISM